MKRIYALIGLFVYATVALAIPACAIDAEQKEELKIEYSSVTFGDVKLSGVFAGKESNRIATIILLKGNSVLADIPTLPKENFEHIGLARVSYEGRWEYSFHFNGNSGSYTYIVICNDKRSEVQDKILKQSDQIQFIDDLSKGKRTVSEVKSFISQYGDKFGLEMDSFRTDKNLTILAKELIGEKKLIETEGFAAFAMLQAVATKKINVIDTIRDSYLTTEIYNAMYRNNDILGIDFTKYDHLSGEKKDAVLSKMQGNDYDFDEIKSAFDALVLQYSNRDNSKSNGSGSGSGSGKGGGGYYGGNTKAENGESTDIHPDEQFSDMAEVKWADDAVNYLRKRGVVSGDGGKFYPNNSVKREEFVKMVVLAFDLYDESAQVNFGDVKDGDWYYPYIASAVKAGLIQGVSADSFGTGSKIIRQDIAVILARALGNETEMTPRSFQDEHEISEYAKKAVSKLSALGIISGMSNGYFAPKNYATRAEAAKLVYETIK